MSTLSLCKTTVSMVVPPLAKVAYLISVASPPNYVGLLEGDDDYSQSRILDVPCKVCGDFSSGKHYNIFACDGCAGFFKRSIRRNRQYVCKAKEEGTCVIDKTHRNQCRACRLQKCQDVGMNKDAVQHERGPRNSTLRRQLTNYFGDAGDGLMVTPPPGVLNLSIPKTPSLQRMEAPYPFNPSGIPCNPMMIMPRFPIAMPLPHFIPPHIPNPAVICESAARLLFMNVQWTKSMTSFTLLPLSDQILLLQRELEGTIHLRRCAISSTGRHVTFGTPLWNNGTGRKSRCISTQFLLDQHEFACLRAIVLFKTSFDTAGPSSSPVQVQEKVLADPAKITSLQDETQLTLNRYIATAHPGQPLRFGKLMLSLPSLRNVSTNTIEQLFFRQTIGNIPIVRIICDMYRAQPLSA
ncbi:hypothetical protein NQ317_015601 [Molorchus minor]|uniref:Nuclear receptor domain-containing protein n=1 Tax=Molorchus minor TaxID=1323400 RepID=A0ABQ9JY09_9CUCU|nr:hypothetical protein NQ317_015601 [Molorchus minor]